MSLYHLRWQKSSHYSRSQIWIPLSEPIMELYQTSFFIKDPWEMCSSSAFFFPRGQQGIWEDSVWVQEAHIALKQSLSLVMNDFFLSLDCGCICILFLCDLSAAFDTIDHCILLRRLEKLVGITVQALMWFQCSLSDRSHFVRINNKSSGYSRIHFGVPQGSVLGPLLFSLYMLPLGNIISRHGVKYLCYAHDTEVYISFKPGESFQLGKIGGLS